MGTTKNQRMSLLFSGVLNVIVTKIHIYNMSTMMMQPIKCNGNYLAESLFQLICNKDARYDIHHC